MPIENRDVCAGGINPGWDACPKCGATIDDSCKFDITEAELAKARASLLASEGLVLCGPDEAQQ
jgi:hypothetical protein